MKRLETWINDELISIDLDSIWRETFAHWDCRVDTDKAAKIATAVEQILTAEQIGPRFEMSTEDYHNQEQRDRNMGKVY